jgi:hypothetical protein
MAPMTLEQRKAAAAKAWATMRAKRDGTYVPPERPEAQRDRQASAKKAWETIRAKRAAAEGGAPMTSPLPKPPKTARLPRAERDEKQARSRTAAAKQALKFMRMTTPELLAELGREQKVLEKWGGHIGIGGWVRMDDSGNSHSGNALSGVIARRQKDFAIARIARIEEELNRRGIDRDISDGWRFSDLQSADPEREGLMLDQGDTSFNFGAA